MTSIKLKIFTQSLGLCLLGTLFAVFAVMGAALSCQRISSSLSQTTASILAPTSASASELVRLDSLVVELVGMIQRSPLQDKEFISSIMDIVPDASSRSSKLMQRVSEVNIEVNEKWVVRMPQWISQLTL